MLGRTSTTLHQAEAARDMFLSATALATKTESVTMTLDGLGRIRSCGRAAAEMFGANRVSLIGRPVSEFIDGLSRGRSSPSYGARYLIHLCACNEWRRFEATGKGGRSIAVELNLYRTLEDGQEIFVLSLRRPEQTACP
jgi:PAS domain S-box-containing protein